MLFQNCPATIAANVAVLWHCTTVLDYVQFARLPYTKSFLKETNSILVFSEKFRLRGPVISVLDKKQFIPWINI
jgi:hypothetical protein